MNRAFFNTMDEAIAHARVHGGWIAECNDGTIQWFDAAVWTMTPVIEAICKHGGGEFGGWGLYDKYHPCQQILKAS